MDYTIKVYGYSTRVNGYRYVVIRDSDNTTVREGVEATVEAADIAADAYLNQLTVQPVLVRHRSVPEE